MKQKPDWAWTVELRADPLLTERGWDELLDAIAAADLESVIYDAILDALAKTLPRQREQDPYLDWYILTIREETP